MLEKKNIDRVFQENFKDLEIVPSKRVWNGIAQDLTSTERKVVPLWRRFAAAAAVSVVFASAAFFYFNSADEPIATEQQLSQEQNQEAEQGPQTPIDPSAVNSGMTLTQNDQNEIGPKASTRPIFVKQPANQVIVTTNSIANIYTNIEDRYVVKKEDFIEELRASESITDRIASIPTNSKEQKQSSDKKWSVGPTVAPVFFNTLQSGSPLSNDLADNSKSSENSLSVGVKVNYQLTPKLFIQSGINRVDLAYSTNDVNAFISTSKAGLNNINTSKPGVYLAPGPNSSTSEIRDVNRTGLTGDINQFMQYYELPIEMKYSLYDQKLGLNLVGGFSTMILSDNSVSFIAGGGAVDLGNASNLNSFNFSGNLGVDLDYKINNSWYLNVAPMFKYQFNTFSGDAGNFRPYYFGLYSGLNYRF
jgi:hypothetical protein